MLKKLWICLLLTMFLPKIMQANTVFFTWYNTEVEIKLGDALEPYLLIPYASLNSPYEDPNLYYERNGVNYTYQSVIQTHVVKTYRLDYKVYSPKYKVTSIQTITFKIIDSIPPQFTKVPMYEVPVFSKSVDYLLGLKYEDNYTPTNKLLLKVDVNAVNLNQIGVYPVLLTVSDEFGNETKTLTYIRVLDYYAPQITQTKPIVIEPNTTFLWHEFFLVKDNYDGVVSVWIHDEAVDYQTIGLYPISIEVYDQSGNMNRLDTTLRIADLTPPELVLLSHTMTLDIHENIDLTDWIIKVKDNHSILNTDDVLITTDLDTTKVGFYEALFEVIDGAGLKTSQRVTIYVFDKRVPVLTFDPLIIEPGQPYDLMSGIHHNHPYRVNIHIHDHNIDTQPGVYDVVYVCVDAYGNHAIVVRNVTVTGHTSPTIPPVYFLISAFVLIVIGGSLFWIWKKRTA